MERREPVTTPHDAEEALRPYLGRLHEANSNALRLTIYEPPEVWNEVEREQLDACQAVIDKALELLGVTR